MDLSVNPSLEATKIRARPQKGRTYDRGNRGFNTVERLRGSPESKRREESHNNVCAADTEGHSSVHTGAV